MPCQCCGHLTFQVWNLVFVKFIVKQVIQDYLNQHKFFSPFKINVFDFSPNENYPFKKKLNSVQKYKEESKIYIGCCHGDICSQWALLFFLTIVETEPRLTNAKHSTLSCSPGPVISVQ